MPKPDQPLDVLVVGQTPPPFMGQAMCMQMVLDGRYEQLRMHHVRMAFSREVDESGHFRWGKLAHLARVIGAIVHRRFRDRPTVLYYTPAGANRIPMYRDFVILLTTRWLFRHLVLHFHAAGLAEFQSRLWWPERLLFRLAYFDADLAIRLSPYTPDDGCGLRARSEWIVPNGIDDALASVSAVRNTARAVPRLLYIGLLRKSKGLLVLLDACRRLSEQGVPFVLRAIGRFDSPAFEKEVMDVVAAYGLMDRVEFTGTLTGSAKWQAMAECDMLVFPSYYEHEAFPLAVLEAMCLEMPVVATRWRGIGSMVEDGGSGYLIPIRDSATLTARIAELLASPALRARMGRRGRELYEAQYTLDRFQANMEAALLSVRTLAVPAASLLRRAFPRMRQQPTPPGPTSAM